MKKIAISLTALILIAFISCKDEKKESDEKMETAAEQNDAKVVTETKQASQSSEPIKVNVILESKSGSHVQGEAFMIESQGKVTFLANIKGLNPGTHAIHLHEKADCSSDDGKSSGGHWNPTHEAHGKWGDEGGFHKGDIGNFEVGEDGYGTIKMQTDLWCIGCGDETKDVLGKAIIVHEGTDDYTSQPSGAAGTRVSCGGIIQQ
jgi:Cu-Zn family superoxide dismutase